MNSKPTYSQSSWRLESDNSNQKPNLAGFNRPITQQSISKKSASMQCKFSTPNKYTWYNAFMNSKKLVLVRKTSSKKCSGRWSVKKPSSGNIDNSIMIVSLKFSQLYSGISAKQRNLTQLSSSFISRAQTLEIMRGRCIKDTLIFYSQSTTRLRNRKWKTSSAC